MKGRIEFMKRINNEKKRVIVGIIAALLVIIMILGVVYPFFN